ncbi:MAG: glutamine synthetase III, partial [Opitutales bacterium]|nr:glutamine synthetase III [Opitutales bacterium]
THYTHWFLPLTGSSAEKHDSFIEPTQDGGAITRFSGKNLILGEPDASSFPSGGLRSTFEARGYTAWDPASPAFIKRVGGVATLCIPTMFCSYIGEVLDKKTPLLRSIQVLGMQVKKLMKVFGVEDNNKHPTVTLGAEQEYFLVDKSLYIQRPDLMQTGRTLFGAPPQKHQQLDDHYFGAIKPRILNFMHDVERELWRIGIPAKTRHNEVAPAQFEIAPVFEEMNLANDHNVMVMEILRTTAEKHGLVCLLHEKPFSRINGSGKHNNWSVSYGEKNLLNPGSSPHENAIFLTTLCAVIKAVDTHADLLRASTAGAGNDHRLGASEAPPAIISIYLGEQLADIIDQIEMGEPKTSKNRKVLKIGVDTLPPLPTDATDRNRTSPFAFTGNKFEFRAPGASQSCSSPNIVLNTIVAEAIDEIAEHLAKLPKKDFQKGLQKLLQSIVKKHKRIIFNGDGYTDKWKREAQKLGLPNLPNTPSALKPYIAPKNIALFEKYGVFTASELHSRYEVFEEEYSKKIHIETAVALNMSKTIIMPACLKYLSRLAETSKAIADVKWGKNSEIDSKGKLISSLIEDLGKANNDLEKLVVENADSRSKLAMLGDMRTIVDQLELEIDDDLWPLPKYSEMLFVY